MGNLTAMAVKAALANPGTYQDGDGLFLKVKKSGGAFWMVRVQRDGQRQDIGLGSAKLVTLAEARQKAQEIRKATRVDRRDNLEERKDEAAAKVSLPLVPCRQLTLRHFAASGVAWADAEVTSGIAFFLGRPRPATGKIMLTSAGHTWINAPAFHNLTNEPDPLVGVAATDHQCFTIPTPAGPIKLTGISSFTRVRAGGYFFLPSKAAILFLRDATLQLMKI